MSQDRLPLVSGTNGQAAAISREEADLRLTTPAPFELVGERRFSLWKLDAPLPPRPPRFSPAFFVTTLGGSLGLLAVGAWVAGRIRQGDFAVGNAFAIGLVVALYGGMAAAVVASRRKRKVEGTPDAPPTGIPVSAVAFQAVVRRRGRSVGWLWFEGDLMCFQGVGFDFRLRREDFPAKRSLFKAYRMGGTPSLRCSKGITEYLLGLRPGAIIEGGFVGDPARWPTLEEPFRVWESGAFTREPTLFPPIRPVPTLPSRLRWPQFVVPPLFMGSILGFAGLVLPMANRSNGGPLPLALAGAAFGLLWPFAVWSGDRAGGSVEAEADRVVRREQAAAEYG